jgi:hypothetical protein
MSQHPIVWGFVSPLDPTEKVRPAVLLASYGDNYALIAPISTNFERTGEVIKGSVLFARNQSPAFAHTGLDNQAAIIVIKDAVLVHLESGYVSQVDPTPVGLLDTRLDKRLEFNLKDLMAEYDVLNRENMTKKNKVFGPNSAAHLKRRPVSLWLEHLRREQDKQRRNTFASPANSAHARAA